ncbi:protein PIGBOS1 [Chiloscyllium plagiosum]|uniref:protein PIGBOS1 n=1 Tax=Chiloscyllium plagiosum TaxID=36176 RepID=UPI001CB7DAFF|nr:protein PIGBOS1 [Chiloscyllium plagiosum]
MAFRRLPFPQLTLAALLGVAGGLYVYKPLFQRYSLEQRKAREAALAQLPESHRPQSPAES